MDAFSAANRGVWDEWTALTLSSVYYDLDAFRQGATSLKEIELQEVGSVAGKSLLHLQCHFGQDTISWARQGAIATGVDFSPRAIDTARRLSDELRVPARFVCTDIYDLPSILNETFDIVFTSYGVLQWLPDLREWARIIRAVLKPGGFFYIVEFHPFLNAMDEAGGYFGRAAPLAYVSTGCYAAPTADCKYSLYSWPHSLSEVINALIDAQLRIEYVHEFPFSVHGYLSFLRETSPGRWTLNDKKRSVPVLFSIRANW